MKCTECGKPILNGTDYFESVDRPKLKMHRHCFLTLKPIKLLRFTGIGGYTMKNSEDQPDG